MTIKEAFINLENKVDRLEKENTELNKNIIELRKENRNLKAELNRCIAKDKRTVVVDDKPKVEEIETQVTSIVTNVDGKVKAAIVEGGSISIDDVAEEKNWLDETEETPVEKPKRNRKKKVEPVSE